MGSHPGISRRKIPKMGSFSGFYQDEVPKRDQIIVSVLFIGTNRLYNERR
jgi:hypothetical protein